MYKRLSIILINFIVLSSFFTTVFHHHDGDHDEHPFHEYDHAVSYDIIWR